MVFRRVVWVVLLWVPLGLGAFDWRSQPSDRLRGRLEGLGLVGMLPGDDRWIGASLDWVAVELGKVPPCLSGGKGEKRRREVLRVLDFPLHVDNFAWLDSPRIQAFNAPVLNWFRRRFDGVISGLEEAVPDGGLRLFKLYNMGFIVCTPGKTVGIDIAGRPAFPTLPRSKDGAFKGVAYALDVARSEKLAQRLDVLLVTHPHRDHYNVPLIREMQRLGKPVILPCRLASRGEALTSESTVLLTNSVPVPREIGGLRLAVFRGHQGSVPCNVYWIDLGSHRLIHTGDNYDLAADRRLAELPRADLLLTACWNHLAETTRAALNAPGERPLVLVPGHDNEMGHNVSHRESWQELFYRTDRLGNPDFPKTPVLLLAPGEHYTFAPAAAEPRAGWWKRFLGFFSRHAD
ncbi:MAG: MBL fold metallo-hydrolase [Kiritimatiellia bacterium]